jgi:hypothetical protein
VIRERRAGAGPGGNSGLRSRPTGRHARGSHEKAPEVTVEDRRCGPARRSNAVVSASAGDAMFPPRAARRSLDALDDPGDGRGKGHDPGRDRGPRCHRRRPSRSMSER